MKFKKELRVKIKKIKRGISFSLFSGNNSTVRTIPWPNTIRGDLNIGKPLIIFGSEDAMDELNFSNHAFIAYGYKNNTLMCHYGYEGNEVWSRVRVNIAPYEDTESSDGEVLIGTTFGLYLKEK